MAVTLRDASRPPSRPHGLRRPARAGSCARPGRARSRLPGRRPGSQRACRSPTVPAPADGSSSNSSRGRVARAAAIISSRRWKPSRQLRTGIGEAVEPDRAQRLQRGASGSPGFGAGLRCRDERPHAGRCRRPGDLRRRARSRAGSGFRRSPCAAGCARSLPARAPRGPAASGRPSSAISPASSGSAPASARSAVVFPEPFAPTSATASPCATSRSSPSRARTPP